MTNAWPFMPQVEHSEALIWATEVIRCRSAEQRVCTRLPRREFTLAHVLTPRQFAWASELAKQYGQQQTLYLPAWVDMSEVGSVTLGTVTLPIDATKTCYAAGGKLFLWDAYDDFEVCTISTIGTGTVTINPGTTKAFTRAIAAPAVLVRFAQEFEAERRNSEYVPRSSARFVGTATADLSGETTTLYPTSYKGSPLVLDPAVVSGGVTETFLREVDVLDNQTGPVWCGSLYEQAIQRTTMVWKCRGADAIWDLRVWLHQRRGRCRDFWVSRQNADLTITADITEDDTTIEVAETDFAMVFGNNTDFVIRTAAGDAYPIRVTSSAAGDPGKEVLTLETAMPASIAVSSITKTSRLIRSRFDSDRVEITYGLAKSALVSVPVVEVPA